MFESKDFCKELTEKLPIVSEKSDTHMYHHGPMTWKVMQRSAWKDIANWQNKTTQQLYKVATHCELANRTTQQLYKVSTPCIDDHHFKEEKNWNLLENCLKFAHKLL